MNYVNVGKENSGNIQIYYKDWGKNLDDENIVKTTRSSIFYEDVGGENHV